MFEIFDLPVIPFSFLCEFRVIRISSCPWRMDPIFAHYRSAIAFRNTQICPKRNFSCGIMITNESIAVWESWNSIFSDPRRSNVHFLTVKKKNRFVHLTDTFYFKYIKLACYGFHPATKSRTEPDTVISFKLWTLELGLPLLLHRGLIFHYIMRMECIQPRRLFLSRWGNVRCASLRFGPFGHRQSWRRCSLGGSKCRRKMSGLKLWGFRLV